MAVVVHTDSLAVLKVVVGVSVSLADPPTAGESLSSATMRRVNEVLMTNVRFDDITDAGDIFMWTMHVDT